MNRFEAIGTIIDLLEGDELLVHANGDISRESFQCKDRERNFYLLGSMGLASSVGLGLALSRPEKNVIILDGDGNILMGFGNLALIGALKPPNLTHVILDNGVYGTTGNQPTISPEINLCETAQACGYQSMCKINTLEELSEAFSGAQCIPGPHFIHIKVSTEAPESCRRIPYSAYEITERFKNATA
ncbi:MAG: thiamine pyrophosphate-dependent enzyme [Candidatus Glassbacteria bacterium]